MTVASDSAASSSRGDMLVPEDVELLYQNGLISHAERLEGLRLAGWRPRWGRWFDILLLVAGTALLLAGGVFFFAWNWQDMHRFLKLGLVQGGIVLASGTAWYMGLDSRSSRSLLVAAGVLVGVFFAVFGQIYQTGADAWEMFRVWTLVLLPWAFAGRSSAFWLLTACLANAWAGLWLNRTGYVDDWCWFAAAFAAGNLAAYLLIGTVGRRLTDFSRWAGWRHLFLALPLGWIGWASWLSVSARSSGAMLFVGLLLVATSVLPFRRRDGAGLVLCLLAAWNYGMAFGFWATVLSGATSNAAFLLLGCISIVIPIVGIVMIRDYVNGKEAA